MKQRNWPRQSPGRTIKKARKGRASSTWWKEWWEVRVETAQCLDPIGLLDKAGNLGFHSMSEEKPFVDLNKEVN